MFCSEVLQNNGVCLQNATTTAEVLVSSDLRGIASHGVARLGRYLEGIRTGTIVPNAKAELLDLSESMTSLDANNGLGQVVSVQAMNTCIRKAEQHGIGIATVKNSNHFGIAGYYVLMALEKNMIGVCMTNSAPLVTPTHGAEAVLGTNPIAFGAPAGRYRPFLLDTATSVVPRGKLEVYHRSNRTMPVGWAVDENGLDCQDPGKVLDNLIHRLGGGILPLGGRGEEFSGYKGYGFALLVDILCGVLSGSGFALNVDNLHSETTQNKSALVGHFFMALDIKRFMSLEGFRDRMDTLIKQIAGSRKSHGQEKIFIPGEKEYLAAEQALLCGIPLADKVYKTLESFAQEYGIAAPRCLPPKGKPKA